LLLVLVLPSAAAAESTENWFVPGTLPAPALDKKPPRYRITPRQAIRVAERAPEVRRERARYGDLRGYASIPLYRPGLRYEISYARKGSDDRVLEVHVSGVSGRVLELWSGPQVAWVLARGYEPSAGGKVLNSAYVWLPLCLLFLAPFFDPRRPLRLLHLDLLVMLGFGLSQYFVNRGELDLSVPLVYPFLAYLLVRLLLAGFRPRERRGRLVPVIPMRVLAIGLILLLAFRVTLNVTDSSVTDIGFASVIGADRILKGKELYTDNSTHGDTYGPINYVAYVPFEQLFPFTGSLDKVPAAQAAALTFDLLTVLGLFVLGARMRRGREGKAFGLALAFAWTAYPYSTYVLQGNTNDSLVALLVVCALLAFTSAPARGALLGLATAAKFAPLALAPLFAAGSGERRPVGVARFGGFLALVVAASVLAYLPDGGLREFYNATLGFQIGRDSPFSLWGLHPSLAPVQTVLTLAAAGLAAALFFVPRRRDLRQVAALAGAVTVALQLAATHWFYFYLVWIAPLALIAVLGAYRWPDPAEEHRAAEAPERELEPVPA